MGPVTFVCVCTVAQVERIGKGEGFSWRGKENLKSNDRYVNELSLFDF